MAFAERLFVSARIPTIIQPVEIVPEPAEEGEEEKEEKSDEEASEEELDVAPPPEVYKTPLNMVKNALIVNPTTLLVQVSLFFSCPVLSTMDWWSG